MTGDGRDTSAPNVRRSARLLAALVWLALAAGASEGQAQTAIEAGFRDYWYGTATNTPTGEKPESKLWWNDGVWWGSLFNDAANQYRIYRFDVTRQEWTDTGTALDTRKSAKADVLWDDASQRLYVVGATESANFPTTVGAADTTSGGDDEMFIVKMTTREATPPPSPGSIARSVPSRWRPGCGTRLECVTPQ